MTPQQLEALVLAAIERVRGGGQIEDDRIEVKRELPEPSKARQLGGAANRGRGAPLIYIIGLDEKTGTVHPNGGTDVASWWSQMSARFDQLPPEMVRHLNIPVGLGESVTAIQFATDRAPYVVTSNVGGSPEREVPLRDGTRTRSATRSELLRMLIPEVGNPPVVILSGSLSGQWNAKVEPDQGRDESTSLSGSVELFIEHIGPKGILLPLHEMFVELVSGDLRLRPGIWLRGGGKEAPPPPAFGLQVRPDGIASTGPGRVPLRFNWSAAGDHREKLSAVDVWTLTVQLGVTGATRPVRADVELARLRRANRNGVPDSPHYEALPNWGYQFEWRSAPPDLP